MLQSSLASHNTCDHCVLPSRCHRLERRSFVAVAPVLEVKGRCSHNDGQSVRDQGVVRAIPIIAGRGGIGWLDWQGNGMRHAVT